MFRRFLLPLTLVFTLAPTTIFSADEDASVFDEVTVTARKRAEPSQSVPIPISALGEEQLEMRNITEIQDIEKIAPNTNIGYSGVNGNVLSVFIRGIGQSNWGPSHDPKIGIYTDGVYSSRPQGGLVDLYDIARVEVLRGPQGTIFGKNTTAGLIHIVTNTPSQEIESKIRAGVGTDGHYLLEGMMNRPINDNLAFRIAFMDKKTDGFIINELTGQDRGNENSTSFRAQLRYENNGYMANLAYSNFDQDERAPLASCRWTGPADANLAGGFGAILNLAGIYNDIRTNCNSTTRDVSRDITPNESVSAQKNSVTLTQSYETNIGLLESVTAYSDLDTFNGTWGWGGGVGPGYLEILNDNFKHRQYSQELRISGSSGALDWVAGVYLFEENGLYGGGNNSFGVPLLRGVTTPSYLPPALAAVVDQTKTFGSSNGGGTTKMQNRAIFFEGNFALTDQLDLTLGARYTEDERDFERFQFLYYGGAAAFGLPDTFDPFYACPGMVTNAFGFATTSSCKRNVDYSETTPRAILSYQQSEDVLLYASYSKGYSSGGFNGDTAMRSFLPETSDNFELGIKSELMDGKLRLNANAFNTSYKNQQVTVGRIVNGQPTADLVNAQEATLQGLELEALMQLTDSLVMAFMFSTQDGSYDEFIIQDNVTNTAADGSLSYSQVERDITSTGFGGNAKPTTWDISFIHTIDVVGGGDIQSSIGMSHQDEINYTLANVPSAQAADYNLVDARITWNFADGQSRLSLWATNLTDEVYINSMLSQAGDVEIGGTDASLGFNSDYWGQPRRFGLEYTREF